MDWFTGVNIMHYNVENQKLSRDRHENCKDSFEGKKTFLSFYLSIIKELGRFFTQHTAIYFTWKYLAKTMLENKTFFSILFLMASIYHTIRKSSKMDGAKYISNFAFK